MLGQIGKSCGFHMTVRRRGFSTRTILRILSDRITKSTLAFDHIEWII